MGRPTISVLCPTGHRGPLVAESLGLLRDTVDEIVVAADARVEAPDLACYADVADTLLRYEHAGPNRHWPWLAAQATCDWILLLDGDEMASAALVAALPRLVADRRIRQYSLPIQWPWPTAEARLAAEPWESDRRLRLLRNDAGLAFAARKHTLADPNPPIAFIDELPVYHLDLLLPDRARREAKVSRYDSELFGLLTPEGVPFNRAFYLPEAREEPAPTLPLPPADAERVARILASPRDASREFDPDSVPFADREKVGWYAPRKELPADAYRARIEIARPLGTFTARRPDHLVWVEVTNEGTARWPGGDAHEPLIRIGMTWEQGSDGDREDVGRALLPHALDPGESVLVPVTLPGPTDSGTADLVLDLVHEYVRWFEAPLTVPVEVGPSVDERLASLTALHGQLIPVDAALAERRAIGARDGLLRQDPPQATPSDEKVAELTASLPVGTWAIDARSIDRIVELVRAIRPAAIVEFGSGTSTIVSASQLADLHGDEESLRLVGFEQDPAWAEHTRAALAERGLDRIAKVIHLPVGEREGGPPGYLMTEEATELLARLSPELIFVDGPTLDSGSSRLAAIEIVAPHLKADATVLLDDAFRDAELSIAEAWGRREDVTLLGIHPTPKGLLELTLRAPKRRRGLAAVLGRAQAR
jgi:predicted O-methyltransferase YrrM